jgi:hypothetical protein
MGMTGITAVRFDRFGDVAELALRAVETDLPAQNQGRVQLAVAARSLGRP